MKEDRAMPCDVAEAAPKKLTVGDTSIGLGETIYFVRTEEHWTKPYVRKRHHLPETRSVILQGKLIDVQGDEFMTELFGNNNFEKDGQTFVFHKGTVLCNQQFANFESLGQWKQDSSSNT